MNKMLIFLYCLVIVMANVITAAVAPLSLGVLLVPAGSILIGVTFILRDLVQQAVGRKHTYFTIGAAMAISAITSLMLGDTLWIVFASVLTFLLSETTDTEIFTRLRLPMAKRVLYSGTIGGIVDSAVFVIIGLSPVGAGVLPWEAVGYAILGQVLAKTAIQLVGAGLFGLFAKAALRRS